jgi:hypothetical protein
MKIELFVTWALFVIHAHTTTLPSSILDLSYWKVTLPIGPSGSPTEIKQPSLATFEDSYFYGDTVGGIYHLFPSFFLLSPLSSPFFLPPPLPLF